MLLGFTLMFLLGPEKLQLNFSHGPYIQPVHSSVEIEYTAPDGWENAPSSQVQKLNIRT